jgi:hypothetical protein
VRRADNLTTVMCRLSRNLGASTSWNPKGLSRPVMELLYLYTLIRVYRTTLHTFTQVYNEEGGRMFLRNLRIDLLEHTVSGSSTITMRTSVLLSLPLV